MYHTPVFRYDAIQLNLTDINGIEPPSVKIDIYKDAGNDHEDNLDPMDVCQSDKIAFEEDNDKHLTDS